MSDPITDIAEAVKDRINSGTYTYSESITAVRAYAPINDKTQLGTVKVLVVPSGILIEREDRTHDRDTVDIDIGIQRVVDPDDNDEIDPLMELVKEIRNRMRKYKPTITDGECLWAGIENTPIYDRNKLREQNIFISVVTSTYRVIE